ASNFVVSSPLTAFPEPNPVTSAIVSTIVHYANNSSINAIKFSVEHTTPADEALAAAAEAAREFGLLVPDAVTAELLRFLAATTAGRAALGGHTPTGIIMSPACGLLGSHLFRGFYAAGATQAHLTCIEPEDQHQQLAENA